MDRDAAAAKIEMMGGSGGEEEGEPIVPLPHEAVPVPAQRGKHPLPVPSYELAQELAPHGAVGGRAAALPLGREGGDAAAAPDAADSDDGSAVPAPKHDPERWSSHTQASMEGVLSCEQVYELLIADSFQPGHRTPVIQKDPRGLHQPALYKECPSPKRRLKGEPGADRWRNSGGEKGRSFLRNNKGVQVVRRRYGTVSQADGTKLKFHEYNLVHQDPESSRLLDSKVATLFHLLPGMTTGLDRSERRAPFATAVPGGAASGPESTCWLDPYDRYWLSGSSDDELDDVKAQWSTAAGEFTGMSAWRSTTYSSGELSEPDGVSSQSDCCVDDADDELDVPLQQSAFPVLTFPELDSSCFDSCDPDNVSDQRSTAATSGDREDEAALAQKALRNFEDFHKIPPGTATLDQVGQSSAGVTGWADADAVADGGEAANNPAVQPKRGHSATGSSVPAKRPRGSSAATAVAAPAVVREPQRVPDQGQVASVPGRSVTPTVVLPSGARSAMSILVPPSGIGMEFLHPDGASYGFIENSSRGIRLVGCECSTGRASSNEIRAGDLTTLGPTTVMADNQGDFLRFFQDQGDGKASCLGRINVGNQGRGVILRSGGEGGLVPTVGLLKGPIVVVGSGWNGRDLLKFQNGHHIVGEFVGTARGVRLTSGTP